MPSTQKSGRPWAFKPRTSNILDFKNFCRKQMTERANREKLARGIPQDAPLCHRHRKELDELAGTTADVVQPILDLRLQASAIVSLGDSHYPLHLPGDPLPYPKAHTIHKNTALVPRCKACFYRDFKLQYGTLVPEGIDYCFCATMFMESSCLLCVHDLIQQDMTAHIKEHLREDVNGNEILTCKCGSLVMMQDDLGELLRKCIGCGGTVTAPFRNFLGSEITFFMKSTVPRVVQPSLAVQKKLQQMEEPKSLLGGIWSDNVPEKKEKEGERVVAREPTPAPLECDGVVELQRPALDPRTLEGTKGIGHHAPPRVNNGESKSVPSRQPLAPLRNPPLKRQAKQGNNSPPPPKRKQSGKDVTDMPSTKRKQLARPNQKEKTTASKLSESTQASTAANKAPPPTPKQGFQPSQTKQLPPPHSGQPTPPQPKQRPQAIQSNQSRRSRLRDIGDRAGNMPLAYISHVMKSSGFSNGDTEKVLKFIMDHGLQEIRGHDFVAAIEKATQKMVED